jgi:branched-chain amino acid transport system substrate-binding protein
MIVVVRNWLVVLGLWAAASLGVNAGQNSGIEATNQSPQPFLHFRQRTLDYPGPEREDAEPEDVKEVNIGWFGPHDETNQLGADLWWAASLAVEEGNAQGGFRGHPFRLVPRWAVDPWGTGVSQLTRMIYTHQPVAVLGSLDSAATHLAEQVVAKARLPLINPFCTDKSITLAGVSWMFSCAPTDDAIARVLVAEILDATKDSPPKLVLLSATDHESRMTAKEVVKEFSRRERLPDFRFDVPPGVLDIQVQLEALARIQPAAVLIVAGAEDAAKLVRVVRDKAPAAAIFGTHALGRFRFGELAGQPTEGVRFPLLFVPNSDDPATASFLKKFVAAHHRAPDYAAAFSYDATRLLLDAIRLGGLNRARVREAIRQLSPWKGITGPISWDGTGQNTRTNIWMGIIRNGAATPIR